MVCVEKTIASGSPANINKGGRFRYFSINSTFKFVYNINLKCLEFYLVLPLLPPLYLRPPFVSTFKMTREVFAKVPILPPGVRADGVSVRLRYSQPNCTRPWLSSAGTTVNRYATNRQQLIIRSVFIASQTTTLSRSGPIKEVHGPPDI